MQIRRLDLENESLKDLTSLLHRAYSGLAEQGFRFLATHQDVEMTRERCSQGETYLMELEGKLMGSVTLVLQANEFEGYCPNWYREEGVAKIEQFAVEPALQRQGYGSKLLEHLEDRAVKLGFQQVAFDTAEGALELQRFYAKRGYQKVGEADWPVTNYRSIIMAKSLSKMESD